MKRLLIITLDLFIIYGSILLMFFFLGGRNYLEHFQENLNAFYIVSPLIGALYLVLMYAFGLYSSLRKSLQDIVYTVFLISLSLMLGTMALCFFVRGGALAFPRSVILLSALVSFIILVCWRLFVWKMDRKLHGIKNVTVIGPHAAKLAAVLREKHRDIYRVGSIHGEDDRKLENAVAQSEVVFLTDGISNRGREHIFLLANEHKASLYFIPEYRDVMIMSASMQKTDDIPTFYIDRMGLTPEEQFVKRMVDLVLGSLGFILALPFFLISAILIKLDGGPVFYSQERLTRDGKVFRVLKFRSMVPNAEKLSGPVLAGKNDPRITRVGKLIRATRLDELPQILNILKGDMSIVGPRPERPFFTEQFVAQTPQYAQRLKVKAGLTGLAQVEGKYNTSFDDKLRYDLMYITHYSLFRDFLIILQTVKILFVKDSTEGVAENKQDFKDFKDPKGFKSLKVLKETSNN